MILAASRVAARPIVGSAILGVELLAPKALVLLALLVPLVILYILKIKRERRKVASTWLWAVAQRDLLAKSPFKRFAPQIPLLLQALALGAMAFALARPATRGRGLVGDHVAIVLDASASMSALADPASSAIPPVSRMDRAKAAAREVLAALAPGSDALVMEAGREARLLSPLDRDLRRVREGVDRARALDVEGDLGQALALAADRLRPLGGARRIVVITDGNVAHPASLSGVALPIDVITVGVPLENAAIVRADVRSSRVSGSAAEGVETMQAFLVVANFGRAPRDLYVTMREDNASDVLASRRVVVKPGERLPIPLEWRPTPADHRKGLVFEISPHDAMPVDDVAYAKVPAGDVLPVTLVGTSPWIERALASDPLVSLAPAPLAQVLQPTGDPGTFVTVAGACPEDVPGGDLLIVAPPPGRCFGTVVTGVVEHPEISSWADADPRLRFLTLDGIHIAHASLLEPTGASQRLVNAREGTLVTDISTSARAGTLVGFDPGESDWPLKASFVLFVRNLLEQARLHRAHGVTGPVRTGEPIRLTIPSVASRVEAVGPDGEALNVSRRADVAVIADTGRAGFYRISWQGRTAGSVLVPANLVSTAESDLTIRALEVEAARITVSAEGTPDAHHEQGWIVALLALLFVVVDVWYSTRDPRAASPVARPAILRPRVPERVPQRRDV